MNSSFDSLLLGFGGAATGIWVLVVGALTVFINLAFAAAVYADARLLWTQPSRRTFLVGAVIWALATLFGGVFVAGIYWVIHHSTLRPQPAPPSSP